MSSGRLFRNYISDSTLQFRFAAMVTALLLLTTVVIVGYSYIYLEKIMTTIFEVPDIPDGAISTYESMIGGYFLGMTIALLGLSAVTVGFVIVQTHKIAGAKFAIHRHIKENMQTLQFNRTVKLRDGDYLKDLALELNELSSILQAKGLFLPAGGRYIVAIPDAGNADEEGVKAENREADRQI